MGYSGVRKVWVVVVVIIWFICIWPIGLLSLYTVMCSAYISYT